MSMMSAKSNPNIIHSPSERHDEGFRHKIGLANWEIRPWIIQIKCVLAIENVFLIALRTNKTKQSHSTAFRFSDLIKISMLMLFFTTICTAQDTSSTES